MINKLAQEINEEAHRKGFYDKAPKDLFDPIWVSNRLMLIVSELAEGLEGVRHGNFLSAPTFGGLGEELADACIRIFDLAASLEIDLEEAIKHKMIYNANRPHMHGGKAI